MTRKLTIRALLAVALLALAACGSDGVQKEAKYPTGADRASTNDDIYAEAPSIFGNDGLRLFGRGADKGGDDGGASGIGVNSYLWRASLDTISFMPLQEVDPFGGVIITDWYANPEMTTERFKVTVYILDTRLRADALSVRVFRQEQQENGGWIDAAVSPETAVEIENAILTRARQLRISNLETE